MTKEKQKTTDYQDFLSTEDCVLEALEKLKEDNDTDDKDDNGTVSSLTAG